MLVSSCEAEQVSTFHRLRLHPCVHLEPTHACGLRCSHNGPALLVPVASHGAGPLAPAPRLPPQQCLSRARCIQTKPDARNGIRCSTELPCLQACLGAIEQADRSSVHSIRRHCGHARIQQHRSVPGDSCCKVRCMQLHYWPAIKHNVLRSR